MLPNNSTNITNNEDFEKGKNGKTKTNSVSGGARTIPCLKQIFLAAENDKALYKDEETTRAIRGLTSQTKRHVRQCNAQEKKFFDALYSTPSLRRLAEWAEDEIGRKQRLAV